MLHKDTLAPMDKQELAEEPARAVVLERKQVNHSLDFLVHSFQTAD